MLKASKMKKCPVCKIKKFSKRRDPGGNKWWDHIRRCLDNKERSDEKCKCGKTAKDFKNNRGFGIHRAKCNIAKKKKKRDKKCRCGKTVKDFKNTRAFLVHCTYCGTPNKAPTRKHSLKTMKNGFACKKCPKKFNTMNQVIAHSWIHRTPENGKEWGDKDAIRSSLQTIAASRLERLPLDKRVAICLPGDRPDHESQLLSDPGFAKIHMVECNEEKALIGQKKGFEVEHGDFLEVMMNLINRGTRLALIDYDLCGMLSYADGSQILEAIRLGGLADIAAVRITCCRRNYKRSGEIDIETLDRDVFHALPPGYVITGKAWNFYVGKRRASMAVQQWLIEVEHGFNPYKRREA